jgi:PLP dependent protein
MVVRKTMSAIAQNLESVRERIALAARRVNRDPASITLVAVSKNHPIAAIEEAYAAGQRDFGENYAQEAREKFVALPYPDIRWHYIGHLQTNKAKYIAPHAYLVHSVDSEKLAEELARRAAADGRILPALIQVNVAGEEQKGGIEPEGAPALMRFALSLPNLDVRGLMTMPPFWPAEKVRPFFARLRDLRDELARTHAGITLPILSMGMSEDFEVAIEQGSSMVRVGAAIFGPR